MTEPSGSKSQILENGALRIGFHWHRDRFAHTIGFVADGRFVPVMASMEGTSEEVWPPSPPLQELHFEDRPEGRVALLVGRTAGVHWSLAVDRAAEVDFFRLDVACRLSGASFPALPATAVFRSLQSGYRTMVPATPLPDHPDAIAVGNLIVRPETENSCLHSTDIDGGDQRRGIYIAPRTAQEEGLRTVCWRYVVSRRIR